MSHSKDIHVAILGGIWQTPTVSLQPIILLLRWRIVEVEGGNRHGERYLIGYNQEDCEGRVSTAIVTFDQTQGQCITQSGRVYNLVGSPGYDPDAEYVGAYGPLQISSLVQLMYLLSMRQLQLRRI